MAATPQPGLKIGTRGSPLALAQAHETRDRLCAAHADLTPDTIEIVVIKTSGDRILDRALAEIGGKGLFTKEIEEALLGGAIDIAVHSMKDMPTELPPGLHIPCYLPREDVRDALMAREARSIDALPKGAVVGSASLRRQAQLLYRRPDLRVVTFRGNVQTRMRKMDEGEVDATFLAMAGLNRLGLADQASAVVEAEEMLPAVAQGAIGIECRQGDAAVEARLAPLNHAETQTRVAAERAFLAELDGSCRTPIAGLAEIADGKIDFRGAIWRPDGSEMLATSRQAGLSDAAAMGTDAGAELKAKAGPGFLAGD